MLDAVTMLFVTVSEVAAAAKLTAPDVLLIVWLPVVPPAVLVPLQFTWPVSYTRKISLLDES